MAGGNPEEDPMQVEKVLDDTENDSDTAAGEGDAAEGVAAGKGSGRKPSKKAKISIIQKNAALHHWEKVLHKRSRADLYAWFMMKYNIVLKPGTFSLWIKPENKQKIVDLAGSAAGGSSRVRAGVADSLGNALREWYLGLPSDSPVNDEHIAAKARKIVAAMPDGAVKSALLDTKKFNFSSGWVTSWKKEHGLKSWRKMDGEKGSADFNAAIFGRSACHKIFYNVKRNRIYNMDETGLLFKCLPQYRIGDGPWMGPKIPKERITLSQACNADGSHMVKIHVIGRAAKPRSFRGWDPVKQGGAALYHSNKTAWQTRFTFTEWLTYFALNVSDEHKGAGTFVMENSPIADLPDLPEELRDTEIYAVLTADNHSSHAPEGAVFFKFHGLKAYVFKKILVVFLPPNTTSLIQPLDQGVIRAFKARYKALFAAWVIAQIDAGLSDKCTPTIAQAVEWSVTAWDGISPTTISNCWRHGGILPPLEGDTVPAVISGGKVFSVEEKRARRELQSELSALQIGDPLAWINQMLGTSITTQGKGGEVRGLAEVMLDADEEFLNLGVAGTGRAPLVDGADDVALGKIVAGVDVETLIPAPAVQADEQALYLEEELMPPPPPTYSV